MTAELKASIRIGAELDPSVRRTFEAAEDRAERLGLEMREIGLHPGLEGDIRGAERATGRLERETGELAQASRGARGAQRQLGDELDRTSRDAREQREELDRLQRELGELGGAYPGAGFGGGGFGGMLGAAGGVLGAQVLRSGFMGMLDTSQQLTSLGTVAVPPGGGSQEAWAVVQAERARQFARGNLADFSDQLATLYEVSSAGILADQANLVAEAAHISTVVQSRDFEESAARAGAGISSILTGYFGGDAAEAMRVAAQLTAVQQSEQVPDAGALLAGLGAASKTAFGLGIDFTEVVGAIGELHSQRVVGPSAGEAFNALANRLSVAADALGTETVRREDGGIAFEATLEALAAALEARRVEFDLTPDAFEIEKIKAFSETGAGIFNLLRKEEGGLLREAVATARAAEDPEAMLGHYRLFAESSAGRARIAATSADDVAEQIVTAFGPETEALLDAASTSGPQFAEFLERNPETARLLTELAGTAGIAATLRGAAPLAARFLPRAGAALAVGGSAPVAGAVAAGFTAYEGARLAPGAARETIGGLLALQRGEALAGFLPEGPAGREVRIESGAVTVTVNVEGRPDVTPEELEAGVERAVEEGLRRAYRAPQDVQDTLLPGRR